MNNKTDIANTVKSIKNLTIQGATNVAKEAVLALGRYSSDGKWSYHDLEKSGMHLALARRTEPLARNAMYWLLNEAKNNSGKSLLPIAQNLVASLTIAKEKIVENGISLIKNNSTILTHCHSSTVTGILIGAHSEGIKFKVYLTETRPRYQGQITARELTSHGISSIMITDSEAVFMISKEDNLDIDLILLGADAIERDGSALNKVGSYGISLSARGAKVPLYVTATILKYAPRAIEIEEREGEEIWASKPDRLKIYNPAFDKIPPENITAFITEYGLIKPQNITLTAKKYSPWIFAKHKIK
ncbi:translation initiation factor eIF-2B [Candidatus Gottesmanbacteria bacterium]|nr:translation initiation factor eIF-2B [Candidatus Gottesmanbacteria bacterium]